MDVVDRLTRQRTLPLLAARIGDERERHAARFEFSSQRLGRKHVTAGAAGRENDWLGAGGTQPDHQTTSRKPACSRVSDSIMPTAIAMASAEDPP